jgi:hypothetical protein
MKCLFLIFILTLLLAGLQNDANAQQTVKGVVLYASKEEIKAPVASAITTTSVNDEKSIATIPVVASYFNNYYGTENFEVYAGEAVDLSLFYLKVKTPFIIPVTVIVINANGEEITRYTNVNHPLAIGYGYKTGVYFIHVCQGKKEMVLRFSKGA